VLRKQLSVADLAVDDDDSAFYGKQYWLQHQQADLDQPDIYARARGDLPERNLHWLKALLKYRLPPARVVELGCAHGSFVALMQQAGFSASGVEMSPWVVGFARRTFGIDVQVGPIEAIDMQPGSLDAIALMDVLEHLPDPASTMAHCLNLLKDDGLLLIQIPEFREGMVFEQLTEENSPFLTQLKADEHIHLFSRRSVTEFFQRLGARHIAFEPAIFAHYDMFLAVGKQPLRPNTAEQVEQALMAIPQARIALALMDMKDRFDAAPVLEAEILARDHRLDEQYVRADELANARNLAEAQFADLLGKYYELEADREARGAVIASQEAQMVELLSQLHASASAKDWRALEAQLAAAESDRIARGGVIETQGERIAALEAMVHERLGELHGLYSEHNELARQAELLALERDLLKQHVAVSESDRAARLQVIESQGRKLSELEGLFHGRLSELHRTYEELAAARSSSQQLSLELDSLKQQFAASEADRDARLKVIESQGAAISALQAQVHGRLQELQRLYGEHEASVAELTLSEQRIQELRTVVDGKIAELESARESHLEESNRLTDEIKRRDAAMMALSERLWWKLGKVFRVL
jgi:SAM-dependent methyltransferase